MKGCAPQIGNIQYVVFCFVVCTFCSVCTFVRCVCPSDNLKCRSSMDLAVLANILPHVAFHFAVHISPAPTLWFCDMARKFSVAEWQSQYTCPTCSHITWFLLLLFCDETFPLYSLLQFTIMLNNIFCNLSLSLSLYIYIYIYILWTS